MNGASMLGGMSVRGCGDYLEPTRPATRKPLPFWRQGFPFFLARPRSPMERLRAYGAARGLESQGRLKRALLRVGMTATWPVRTFFDAIKLAGQADVRGDRSSAAMFASLYRSALLRNVPPQQYARYRLLYGADEDALADYLFPMDARAFDALNRRQGAANRDVQDKQRFAAICARHGLPHVETIATFRDGKEVGPNRLTSGSAASVFVKALSGKAGDGAEIWQRQEDRYVGPDGRRLGPNDLSDLLRGRDCIVQPLLRDVAALRSFGAGALSSLRIVTARNASGVVAPVAACLNLATEEGSATSHSGRLYGIELAGGRVANVYSPPEGDAGNPAAEDDLFLGVALPDWAKALQLVVEAHGRAFPAFVTLGWDVALTDDGPFLLEANHGWNLSQHQVLNGPLGKTSLGPVIEEALGGAR